MGVGALHGFLGDTLVDVRQVREDLLASLLGGQGIEVKLSTPAPDGRLVNPYLLGQLVEVLGLPEPLRGRKLRHDPLLVAGKLLACILLHDLPFRAGLHF